MTTFPQNQIKKKRWLNSKKQSGQGGKFVCFDNFLHDFVCVCVCLLLTEQMDILRSKHWDEDSPAENLLSSLHWHILYSKHHNNNHTQCLRVTKQAEPNKFGYLWVLLLLRHLDQALLRTFLWFLLLFIIIIISSKIDQTTWTHEQQEKKKLFERRKKKRFFVFLFLLVSNVADLASQNWVLLWSLRRWREHLLESQNSFCFSCQIEKKYQFWTRSHSQQKKKQHYCQNKKHKDQSVRKRWRCLTSITNKIDMLYVTDWLAQLTRQM